MASARHLDYNQEQIRSLFAHENSSVSNASPNSNRHQQEGDPSYRNYGTEPSPHADCLTQDHDDW